MRQFYLGKNSSGYYRVYFVDPVTGTRGPGKSTHTKDKVEATLIVGQCIKYKSQYPFVLESRPTTFSMEPNSFTI